MSRLLVSATTDYLESTTVPVSAYAFSFAIWVYPVTISAAQTAMSLTTSASDIHYWTLDIAATNAIRFRARDGTTSTDALTTATIASANTWNHLGAVAASATSRSVYLNGANKITSVTSRTPSGVNRFSLGRKATATALQNFNGRLAEAAVWNVALSDTDMAMLGTVGVSPLMVRPDALVRYYPLISGGSPEVDLMSINTMTLTNTSVAVHPFIHYKTEGRIAYKATASGGGGGAVLRSRTLLGIGQ